MPADHLLPISRDLALLADASLNDLEALELGSGVVDLHLDVHLSHARPQPAEDGGQEGLQDFQLVGLLIVGDVKVGNVSTVLILTSA